MNKNINNSRPGIAAVTIMVLIIAVLGISTALFYLSNTRSSLRETIFSLQRNQSLSCAESAVDIAIQCIDDLVDIDGEFVADPVANCLQIEAKQLDAELTESCSYKYELESAKEHIFLTNLNKDDTEVVLLNPNVSYNIDIRWNTDFENSGEGNILEVGHLTEGAPGEYKLKQVAYPCNHPGTGVSTKAFPNDSINDTGTDKYCAINISSDRATYLLLTPRFNYANSIDILQHATDVPVQGYKIKTTGIDGESVRNIESLILFPNILRMMNNTIYMSSFSN